MQRKNDEKQINLLTENKINTPGQESLLKEQLKLQEKKGIDIFEL